MNTWVRYRFTKFYFKFFVTVTFRNCINAIQTLIFSIYLPWTYCTVFPSRVSKVTSLNKQPEMVQSRGNKELFSAQETVWAVRCWMADYFNNSQCVVGNKLSSDASRKYLSLELFGIFCTALLILWVQVFRLVV